MNRIHINVTGHSASGKTILIGHIAQLLAGMGHMITVTENGGRPQPIPKPRDLGPMFQAREITINEDYPEPPRPEPERTVVTCVYCGHEYPDGTPTAKADALTAHVKVCDKHPMKRVRSALAALVGADTREELFAMRDAMFAVTMPARERADMVDAIDALLETLP